MFAICRARGAWASHRHSQAKTVVLAWSRRLQREDQANGKNANSTDISSLNYCLTFAYCAPSAWKSTMRLIANRYVLSPFFCTPQNDACDLPQLQELSRGRGMGFGEKCRDELRDPRPQRAIRYDTHGRRAFFLDRNPTSLVSCRDGFSKLLHGCSRIATGHAPEGFIRLDLLSARDEPRGIRKATGRVHAADSPDHASVRSVNPFFASCGKANLAVP